MAHEPCGLRSSSGRHSEVERFPFCETISPGIILPLGSGTAQFAQFTQLQSIATSSEKIAFDDEENRVDLLVVFPVWEAKSLQRMFDLPVQNG